MINVEKFHSKPLSRNEQDHAAQKYFELYGIDVTKIEGYLIEILERAYINGSSDAIMCLISSLQKEQNEDPYHGC